MVGYIEAKKTCDLINHGVTDRQQINYMIQKTLSSDDQYLLDVVAYHLEHYGKDELVNAYFDGFIKGIKPCQDDYDRLFLNE